MKPESTLTIRGERGTLDRDAARAQLRDVLLSQITYSSLASLGASLTNVRPWVEQYVLTDVVKQIIRREAMDPAAIRHLYQHTATSAFSAAYVGSLAFPTSTDRFSRTLFRRLASAWAKKIVLRASKSRVLSALGSLGKAVTVSYLTVSAVGDILTFRSTLVDMLVDDLIPR